MKDTLPESISGFLRWAEARLEKEILDNEVLESEFGDEIYKEKPIPKIYTESDRLDVVNEVQGYVEEGHTVHAAAEMAGIHVKTYYNWKQKLKK